MIKGLFYMCLEGKNALMFKAENYAIYNENCFERIKKFPDNYFDLVVTDPPYGINLTPHDRDWETHIK